MKAGINLHSGHLHTLGKGHLGQPSRTGPDLQDIVIWNQIGGPDDKGKYVLVVEKVLTVGGGGVGAVSHGLLRERECRV